MDKILENTFLTALGTNIRRIRMAKGVTQKALAFNCDIEPSSMNKIEKGKSNCTVHTLISLCNCLEISPQVLFDF